MKTCYIYSIVVPFAGEFKDNQSTPPLMVIPIKLKDGRLWEGAVLGTQTTITAIRVSIPNIPEENPEGYLAEDDFKLFVRLRIYMLDCIRLIYNADAEYLRQEDQILSFRYFLEPDEGPDSALKISMPINPDYRVNSEGLKALIGAPESLRPIIHLMADGADTKLPIQFRFLSYYKIIEIHYKITTNKRFSKFITSFISEFKSIYPTVSSVAQLCKRLSMLRNRCAHIKLTTGEFGFSHLEAKADDLIKTMPIIRRVAVHCIIVNHPDSPIKFSTSPEETAAQIAEMVAVGKNPIRIF